MSSLISRFKAFWPAIELEWSLNKVQFPIAVREAGDAFVAAFNAYLKDEAAKGSKS